MFPAEARKVGVGHSLIPQTTRPGSGCSIDWREVFYSNLWRDARQAVRE